LRNSITHTGYQESLDQHTDHIEAELCWAGGFVSRHALRRPVQTYEQLLNYKELLARIDALRAERKTLSEIAATLNTGYRQRNTIT
jgi:hypothetical protein